MTGADHPRRGPSTGALPRFGLGTAALGGLYDLVPEAQAHATVDAALAHGVTWFDTAPSYGYGEAERRLGAALAGRPRSSFTISTKVGYLVEPRPGADTGMFRGVAPAVAVPDLSGDGVRRSLEASLQRLGTDHVEVVFLHDPEDHLHQARTEAWPALAALRDEGTVGAIGLGIKDAAIAASFVRDLDLDVVLIAGRWTLLDQRALDELLPAAHQRRTAIAVAGVFNSGILADPAAGHFDYGTAPTEVLTRARALAQVCARHHVDLRAAALQFPWCHPAVSSVVLGARSVEELTANLALAAAPVPPALWDDLVTAGLLAEPVGSLTSYPPDPPPAPATPQP